CGSTVDEPAFQCTGSEPILSQGQETGYESCSEGYMHRASAVTCGSSLPRAAACESSFPEGDSCTQDSDCTEQPNGYCNVDDFGGGNCYCSYGCTADADCGDGQICVCGEPVGRCVKADCKTDGDCAGDLLCTTYVTEPGCGGTAFACQTAEDECAQDADCDSGEQCTLDSDGVRVCEQITCAIGRPFLVEGHERRAEPTPRGDWSRDVDPMVDELTVSERRALARHWTDVGLMEHASIAAFARFALQLLAQGAPADLVERTHEAMADETRHARAAFALASAYAGELIGPGPLPMEGALEDQDAATILRLVVREGCIGETVAAIEAAEAASHASDPVVRVILEGIAADEHRHAELAWKYVDWVLSEGDAAMTSILLTEIEHASIEAGVPFTVREGDGGLLAHGAPGETRRRHIRRQALADVVSPCARELVGKHRQRVRRTA
ncbi:MAG: ferritin-like domain-containing protein, partial [Polyangiaceae bacterium]